MPAALLAAHHPIVLNLGDVKDVAEININGRPGPRLLVEPYKADITALLHEGENTLQITVVNALFNALSAQGPNAVFAPEEDIPEGGLLPAGLIGPVRLEAINSGGNP